MYKRQGKRYDADLEDCYLAGLAHDIAKEMPQAEQLAYLKRSSYGEDEILLQCPQIWHAPVGAMLLQELQPEYPEIHAEIISACLWHTIAKPAMSKLEAIIFLADMIEPNRDWPGVAELRKTAWQSLEQGVVAALQHSIAWLSSEKKQIHPQAFAAYQYYQTVMLEEKGSVNGLTEMQKETQEVQAETVEQFSLDDVQALAKAIAGFAYEKKAKDIIGLDLRGISPVTDYFLICSGSNKPQIKAICDHIEEKLKEQQIYPQHLEGYQEATWVLMDYGTFVIHVFAEEEREYFNLEHLWGEAPAYRFTPAKS